MSSLTALVVMPPTLTNFQIQSKLDELREFVQENLAEIRVRRDTTLLKSLRQNHSSDERKWYKFLLRHGEAFTARLSVRTSVRAAPPLRRNGQ